MKPHEERVVAEESELNARLDKLADFMAVETFRALATEDQALLSIQARAMSTYLTVLRARIGRFQP